MKLMFLLTMLIAISCSTMPKKGIDQSKFGEADGKKVVLYTLVNENGLTAKLTNYGATLTEMLVPDKNGKFEDVVLGFKKLDKYQSGNPYFGVTTGRVANHTKGAKFSMDGKVYKLSANNGVNHLHGGEKGWDKRVWDSKVVDSAKGLAVEFTYTSEDGEQGYPNKVMAKVVYTLTDDNELLVDMSATTDKKTPVSMTHHSYWNMAGHGSGTVLDQELWINADKYTLGAPFPNGRIASVKGTPFDFSKSKAIGKDLMKTGGNPIGYDHNFVINGAAGKMREVAKLKDPKSGRLLTILSDQEGLQFYTGNYLDGKVQGKGATYPQYGGLCLQSQFFPNSVNVANWKDKVFLKKGQTYQHHMIHRFSAK